MGHIEAIYQFDQFRLSSLQGYRGGHGLFLLDLQIMQGDWSISDRKT